MTDRPAIAGPVEIKGFDPNLFKQITTISDFSRYAWMAKYLTQLTTYELGSNFETGWFLIFNKANLWEYKFIELPLDFALAEKIVQTADAVNKHIESDLLPDRLNDPDICPTCPFVTLCCPDYTPTGNVEISTDEFDLDPPLTPSSA